MKMHSLMGLTKKRRIFWEEKGYQIGIPNVGGLDAYCVMIARVGFVFFV